MTKRIRKIYGTEKIHPKDNLIKFLEFFLGDYHKNFEKWKNSNLENFLQVMLSWTEDADGYYQNISVSNSIDTPSWRLFADMLLAVTMYEQSN